MLGRNDPAFSMRLLAISDIHGQIDPVHRLRTLAQNSFDVIILAGDIGNDLCTTTQVFDILKTFDCPILYVYGNWDHSLSYDHDFGSNCHHLHDAPFRLGDWTVGGFSGVDANWGQNPLAASIAADIDARYEADAAEIDGRIDALERSERELLTECEALPPQPNKAHLRPVWVLRRKHVALRDKLQQQKADLRATLYADYGSILEINRRQLVERISGAPHNRTIVVTHARLARTAVDMPEVPLFLFGHRHGFTDTLMGRSRYVNVSALDHVVRVIPEHATQRVGKEMRAADIGAFTIIEIANQIVVRSVPLRVMPPGWKQVSGSTVGWGFQPLDQGT